VRRWYRRALVATLCAAVGLVVYFSIQQYRIRPAPKLKIGQVGWIETRTCKIRTFSPVCDEATVLRILRAWNASGIGPLRGGTTPDLYITVFLRSGRTFDVFGWCEARYVALDIEGLWRHRSFQVYPSRELKAYILELAKDYEESQ
jgi:hypothetical protein